MSGAINPVAEGDYNSGGTLEPFTIGLTQTDGTPTNVSFESFDLSALSSAQVLGIEAGTMQVTLSYDSAAMSAVAAITGLGVSGAVESALAAGTDPSAYQLITNPTDTLASGTLSGFETGTINITSQIAAALEGGAADYVVGAYITSGPGAIINTTLSVTCFAAGTRLLTARGDVAVEALRADDRVIAGLDATPQPIIWRGERSIDLRAHPRPEQAAPIRIAAGAFADNLPVRDLLLSPEHCVFVDGRLIPARQLVNGTSVVQMLHLPSVQYFHVELARHTVLRSEGVLTESYLDTGNRAVFHNAGMALILHPEFSVNAGVRTWRDDGFAPLATAEEALAVWRRLAARAAATGWGQPALPAATLQSAPRLIASGRSLSPIIDGERLIFALPPRAAGTLRLVSRATAPATLRPWEDDRRALGVCVRALVLHGAEGARRVAVDDPAFGNGWWAIERGAHGLSRWTDGDAAITLPAAAGPVHMLEVVLQSQPQHLRTGRDRKAA